MASVLVGGASACQKSMLRIPINDKRIMDFILDNCKEAESSTSLTKGWLDGYARQIDQDMKAAGFLKAYRPAGRAKDQ